MKATYEERPRVRWKCCSLQKKEASPEYKSSALRPRKPEQVISIASLRCLGTLIALARRGRAVSIDHISRQVHTPASPAPTRVIAADGSLKELLASSTLVAVSDVLGLDSGGDTVGAFFVCNADALYFNEHPPALARGDLLRPGQMYFVLPTDFLGRPLSAVDMATLAVRASVALASGSSKPQRRGRRGGKSKKAVRVRPVQEDADGVHSFIEKLNELTLGQVGVLLMSPAKTSDEKLAAAERSRLKRALSIIREDAE
ncbi:hypothetical protein BAE44_0025849 [Dichanthelium oligosanthes]|uniref:Uncharacterized protein n=1 Tax=Dichanthelium oligosanthes TaxID=888268 RepID=A0A1E5UJR8_9POAL|nr:hypothetical protein BAE44_0025849 [Dichanthelium oligosanthes]